MFFYMSKKLLPEGIQKLNVRLNNLLALNSTNTLQQPRFIPKNAQLNILRLLKWHCENDGHNSASNGSKQDKPRKHESFKKSQMCDMNHSSVLNVLMCRFDAEYKIYVMKI